MDGVAVRRYRYAPAGWETLVNDGGMVANLRGNPLKWLLVPGFLLSQAWVARRLIRQKSVDVLHVHWLVPQGLVMLLLRWSGCTTPYLVTSHGADLYSLRGAVLNALKRRIAKGSAAMTVVSSAMRAEVARVGIRPPRLEVLPMGVDLQGRFGSRRRPGAGRGSSPVRGAPGAEERSHAPLGRIAPGAGAAPDRDSHHRRFRARGTFPACPSAASGSRSQGGIPGGAAPERVACALPERGAVRGTLRNGMRPVIRKACRWRSWRPSPAGCPVVAGDVAGLQDLLGHRFPGHLHRPRGRRGPGCGHLLAVLDNTAEARAKALTLRQAVAERVDWAVIAAGYARLLKSCVQTPGKARS